MLLWKKRNILTMLSKAKLQIKSLSIDFPLGTNKEKDSSSKFTYINERFKK